MSACPFAKPADESACPFGTSPTRAVEEANTNLAEQMAKCTTYQTGGCPIDNKAKDDIEDLLSLQTQRSISLNGKVLDRFMPEAYPNKLEACQLLDDPQLATAMRKGTKVVHELAEKSVFTKRFLRGDINKSEYGQYIRSLYFVYKCMEGLLEKHQQHPAIEMIFFPDELNRVDALLEDLEFFYGAELVPRVTDPATMTPAVKQYVQSMEHAALVDPALLVSHSYARYLGDLSGGQILAKRLKKHILHLSKDDSSWDSQQGVAFYYFNNIGKLNEFKNLYREQLDQVPVTEALKTSIVDEAIWCFKLNIALFDEIQRLSESNALIDIDHQESTAPMADDMVKERDTSKLRATWPSLPSSWPNAAMALTSVALLSIGCSFYMRQKA